MMLEIDRKERFPKKLFLIELIKNIRESRSYLNSELSNGH